MDRVFLINILTALAVLLEIFWIVSDPRSKKERFSSYFQPRIFLYAFYSTSFFTLNYLSGRYFPLPNSGLDPVLTLIGLISFTGGIILAIWAKLTMGKIWGMPAEHHLNRQDKIIKTGPFRYTRNPIYLGLIMVLIGYGLALQSYFTFLTLIAIYYFWNSTEKEELLLEKHFKEAYLKYKKEVPRFF